MPEVSGCSCGKTNCKRNSNIKGLIMNLNRYIDHTLLKADATSSQVAKLCQEAKEHEFFSVCINSYYVKKAVSLLQGSKTAVCTVVGFPLGASTMETKRFECHEGDCRRGAGNRYGAKYFSG